MLILREVTLDIIGENVERIMWKTRV